jgi:hypothetical protein
MHSQVQHPVPLVDVPDFQRAELLAPQSVVEQHREDGAIPLVFLRLGPGGVGRASVSRAKKRGDSPRRKPKTKAYVLPPRL